MRRAAIALAGLVIPVVVSAQSPATITAAPLPPIPSLQGTQPPPLDQQKQATPPAKAPNSAVTAPTAPQSVQLTWQPQGTARVQVLDKVNAQSTVLTLKVGQQGQYGSLTIQVQACDTHPADQPQDYAAYLTITDGHADAPGFQGWMLANEPSAAMLQSPIYDVRVVGCQA